VHEHCSTVQGAPHSPLIASAVKIVLDPDFVEGKREKDRDQKR